MAPHLWHLHPHPSIHIAKTSAMVSCSEVLPWKHSCTPGLHQSEVFITHDRFWLLEDCGICPRKKMTPEFCSLIHNLYQTRKKWFAITLYSSNSPVTFLNSAIHVVYLLEIQWLASKSGNAGHLLKWSSVFKYVPEMPLFEEITHCRFLSSVEPPVSSSHCCISRTLLC